MAIPKNLTHEECGALLIVVGRRMRAHSVTADVVLDLGTYSDPDETLIELCQELSDEANITLPRSREILEKLTLVEAVSYNSYDGSHLAYDTYTDAWHPNE